MLGRVAIENYRVFTEQIVFTMLPTKDKSNTNCIANNLLKTSGIFGANKCGKSDIFRTLEDLKYFLLGASKYIFQESKGESKIELMLMINNIRYDYSICFDKNSIKYEYLYFYPNKREELIFLRKNNDIKLGNKFKKYRYKLHDCKKSFLRLLFHFSSDKRILDFLTELGKYNFVMYNHNIPIKYKEKPSALLKNLDLFDKIDECKNQDRVLMGVLACINETLSNGGTIFIDDFGSNIHHNIQLYLLDLFNSSENDYPFDNPNNAQLIFTSYNALLLDNPNFRRDQIWFIEKNRHGVIDLFSLVEYIKPNKKHIKKELPLSKDYINGRFGGIPFIRQFNPLFNNEV